jgi:hypothetical protein
MASQTADLEQLCPTFAEYLFYEGAFSAGSVVSVLNISKVLAEQSSADFDISLFYQRRMFHTHHLPQKTKPGQFLHWHIFLPVRVWYNNSAAGIGAFPQTNG